MAEVKTHPFPAHKRVAQAWAIRQEHNLPPMVGYVLLALAEHVGCDSGESWPSVQRLAELTGLCARSVKRALKRLREATIIEARPATVDAHTQKSTVYRLPFLEPAEGASVKPPADWPLLWTGLNKNKGDGTHLASLNKPLSEENKGAVENKQGDTQSPQGCQRVTPRVSESHPKGDTQSPKPGIEQEKEQEKEQGRIHICPNKTFSDPDPDGQPPKLTDMLVAVLRDKGCDVRTVDRGGLHAARNGGSHHADMAG